MHKEHSRSKSRGYLGQNYEKLSNDINDLADNTLYTVYKELSIEALTVYCIEHILSIEHTV